MIRLFVALEIPDFIKENISLELKRMTPDYEKFKWEPENKIHLTLKFIGSVKEELVSEIESSLNFITEFESYKCETANFNFFYRNGKPSIFYLNFNSDKNLKALSSEINEKLAKFDISEEKKDFKVHLTLLRLKGHEDISPLEFIRTQGVPKTQFIADEVVLYKSKLQPKGSVYTKLKTYKLRSTKDE